LFPLLSRWWRVDPARFQVVYQRGTEALVAYALPFPILLAFTAGPMVAVVYAPSFAPSALPLALLAVSMVLMVFSAWQSLVLLVGGLQRVALAYNLASLAVNAVLNVVLILRFGYLGASAAAVASSVFMAALSVAAPARLMGVWPDPRRLLRVLAAGALLAASVALLLWLGLPWPAALAAAAVLYPAWLLACRVATPAELRIFLPARVQDAAGAVGAG
ncbi:MAG TPA: polysaccharide biosynthesis C-terminal domain-containing protein, partial [Candidatus Acidoferrales bacterium]|nr:polysaccharide biosynthesis C-terminal domain-containing protein [Candidatus Acidoferrales bacterium]